MSEPTPPAVPASHSEPAAALTGAAPVLGPDRLAAVLEDFEDWLNELAAAATPAEAPPRERVELHTLLGSFLALRHEVNLQTKAVRAQQEQNSETLQQLAQAVETLEDNTAAAPAAAEPTDERLRSCLKALVDVHDALALAAREVKRVQDTVLPLLELTTKSPPPQAPPVPVTGWARWLGFMAPRTRQTDALDDRRREQEARQAQEMRTAAERSRQLLSSLITGYTMSLQRVERVLQQQGLETIPCVGAAFDPELMEALEAVSGSGRPAGEVLEEVRRGYRWNDRVFRFAQVRVASK